MKIFEMDIIVSLYHPRVCAKVKIPAPGLG